MADEHITIAISDEGYFKKFFKLSPHTNLKKLLDTYRGHLCRQCSNPDLLDFWYDTTQIQDGHTAQELKMATGDQIDVRITATCTRGACPIPLTQTLPNLHYLHDTAAAQQTRAATGPSKPSGAVTESQDRPLEPIARIAMTIKDQNGQELTLRVKKNTPFRKVLEAYARQAEREAGACRLYLDGRRLGEDDTPEGVEMEEGDLVDVYMQQLGGGLRCEFFRRLV